MSRPARRGAIEMPDQDLLVQGQVDEAVRVDLGDRRFVNPLEQILPIRGFQLRDIP